MSRYYYADKGEAIAQAKALEDNDPRVQYTKVEFEPHNGWVIVAIPKVQDITDLKDWCEVRHPNGFKLTSPPANRRRAPKPTDTPRRRYADGPPPPPADPAKVAEIKARMQAEAAANKPPLPPPPPPPRR